FMYSVLFRSLLTSTLFPYTTLFRSNGENFLLCIGKPHKVGQVEDNEQHINDLVAFLQTRFEILEVTHRWGGQHYKPADHLPYIRSEEHTSELQSRENLVCRLLLEKK